MTKTGNIEQMLSEFSDGTYDLTDNGKFMNSSTYYLKIQNIADTYGYDAQSRQCIEEMAELTQAINKFWRKQMMCGFVSLDEIKAEETEKTKLSDEKGYQNLVEEIADVQIMLWQMAYLLNADVTPIIEQKLDMQLERIEKCTSS